MISTALFEALVHAASLAPSADNMQNWEFGLRDDVIDVFMAQSRVLPTDCRSMFAWVGVGAALENMVLAAAQRGLRAKISYATLQDDTHPAASVRLSPGDSDGQLGAFMEQRSTNRTPYDTTPLESALVGQLTSVVAQRDARVHWVSGAAALARMSRLEANSTYIRLEHPPLHDELFEILRFTRRDIELTRYGLDFATLGTPPMLAFMARQLRYRWLNDLVSRLGVGRLVAKGLATRLRHAGALCLVTARHSDPAGYMEAGRAMQRLWLACTRSGLAAQPFGALPQYLTKLAEEPGFFGRYARALAEHREPFLSLFPGARVEHPAIVLRIGRARSAPERRRVRLAVEQLVRRRTLPCAMPGPAQNDLPAPS